MNNTEKNAIYNSEARENRGGGYRALEAEAVEKSVAEYIRNQNQEERMEEAGYDPRILASKAEAEARGFDMSMNLDYLIMDNNQNG